MDTKCLFFGNCYKECHRTFAISIKAIYNVSIYKTTILSDDVIKYIAERHHTTEEKIMECFNNLRDKNISHEETLTLEENELQIIHDLINLYK